MKKILTTALLLCTMAFVAFFYSCDGKKVTPPVKKWKYDFNTYPGLVAAKDGLLNTKPWDVDLFDTLLVTTYSNQNYGAIDYNEAYNIFDGIFKGGANMVLTAVDSTMMTSVYNKIEYWKKLSSQIAAKTAEYQKIYGALESPNANLLTVDDMIRQYEVVLGLSRSSFRKDPTRIERYNISYQPTEDKIKSNKYWKDYFCHNSAIKQGISEFPQRARTAQSSYYKALKDKIIKRAQSDNITKDQLAGAVSRYQNVTSGSEQSMRDELASFLMRYQESETQEVSNDSFWR